MRFHSIAKPFYFENDLFFLENDLESPFILNFFLKEKQNKK